MGSLNSSIVAIVVSMTLTSFPVCARAQLDPGQRAEVEGMIAAAVDRAIKDKERDDIIAELTERVVQLENKLNAITASEPRNGGEDRHYVAFTKMADIPAFTKELSQVVQAKLKLPPTSPARTVLINGVRWNVQPVGSHVWVPLGKVVVHFPRTGQVEVIDPEELSWENDELTLSPSDDVLNALGEASNTTGNASTEESQPSL